MLSRKVGMTFMQLCSMSQKCHLRLIRLATLSAAVTSIFSLEKAERANSAFFYCGQSPLFVGLCAFGYAQNGEYQSLGWCFLY